MLDITSMSSIKSYANKGIVRGLTGGHRATAPGAQKARTIFDVPDKFSLTRTQRAIGELSHKLDLLHDEPNPSALRKSNLEKKRARLQRYHDKYGHVDSASSYTQQAKKIFHGASTSLKNLNEGVYDGYSWGGALSDVLIFGFM
jgi:hypothetical protein